MTSCFRLLVLSDAHYAPTDAGLAGTPAERRCRLGRELLHRAIDDAKRRGGFDAIALMGDMLNDGDAADAESGLADIRNTIHAAAPETPLLVVPGNHDGDPDRFLAAFQHGPGMVELGGYRFVTFADSFDERDNCTRSAVARRSLMKWAAQSDAPLVVLQHNPVYPNIVSDYPYMLTNRIGVMTDYTQAGVFLSISGHYHAGQPPVVHNGVKYFTAQSLATAPFPYTIITISGRNASIETRHLQLDPEPWLVDCHAHTEFAYCGRDVTADSVISRSRTFGLAGVVLVEHSPQLYCSADDFWHARHIRRPELWRERTEHYRMGQFRRAMLPLRDDYVRIGLEVEVDTDGRLIIHDEDREWADLLVGAVHWPHQDGSDSEAAAFLRTTDAILSQGVDILAHPLRFFRRFNQPVPDGIGTQVADMLAATGTAAEINLHTNDPDPQFLADCIGRGVKLSLASDCHSIHEAGALTAHLALLRQLAGGRDLGEILFQPPQMA